MRSSGPVVLHESSFSSGAYSAKALPGMPEFSPYAPVIIAVWFGLVSAIITDRDSG